MLNYSCSSMQYYISNNSLHISVKVCLFLHPLLVRLLSLVTILMVSLPFNSYLQGLKITEGLFWIRGGISASAAQEKGMPSPFGASLAAIKCSFYLSKGEGKLKVLSFHKAKKPKNEGWKSLADLLWRFHIFSYFSLLAQKMVSWIQKPF